ncbi:DNA alkylation repair protein [Endomicrobium proavitum]|uniref:Putative DNA alkylation repair enzyme n=1 Tax=Endomicrobium proavitum TaxID=1408281 RepID=A0A0G3WL90_9BACT|nr:DNA alkylation repair protein [Endomicrobium proavitum]AKL98274.1 putative DNA alkylation repair enzyme [Endomicrobium proavitum]
MSDKKTVNILSEIKKHGNKVLAQHHLRFFKTGKGEYGEGDLFWGLTVPQTRAISKKYYKELTLKETEIFLKHKVHEVRFFALTVLIEKYKRADIKEKKKIVKIYLKNTKYINNWDLVDLTAPLITGEYWYNNLSEDLWKLAKSKNLWEERIAMLSTFYFIKRGKTAETLKLAEFFLNHKHDLMHKASGWMLREAGKRNIGALYGFLDKYAAVMPRTMLRYSLEKVPQQKRKYYMEKK